MPVDAIAFDVFGTLFDLDGLRPVLREELGERGDAVFDGFETRFIPWTWHSSASRQFRHLPDIAASAIAAAGVDEGIDMAWEQASAMALALRSLPPFPGVDAGLAALAGWRLAVLTNGTQEGVAALLGSARLSRHFKHLLTADHAGRYKPSPSLYALAPRAFRTRADRVLLVTGNEWDVAGAGQSGMRTAWLARGRAPAWVLGVEADWVVDSLEELMEVVGSGPGEG